MISIHETQPEDVFIAGYPKSGNTWFQYIVAGLVHGVPPESASDAVVQALVPDVHATRQYERRGPVSFFKTHHLPRPEHKNVVVLVRDGRDVMVSYLHHRRAVERANVDFAAMIEKGEGLFPCRWHAHVDAWLGAPNPGRLLFIRFEDLVADPVHELVRFCDFARIDRSLSEIQIVADSASFERMSARERNKGWADAVWPKDQPFLRVGRSGAFRDEMPQDLLVAFEREAGPTLERLGYALAAKEELTEACA